MVGVKQLVVYEVLEDLVENSILQELTHLADV